ncbi:unnamed protein product, partial [marine sediment metagenome]
MNNLEKYEKTKREYKDQFPFDEACRVYDCCMNEDFCPKSTVFCSYRPHEVEEKIGRFAGIDLGRLTDHRLRKKVGDCKYLEILKERERLFEKGLSMNEIC